MSTKISETKQPDNNLSTTRNNRINTINNILQNFIKNKFPILTLTNEELILAAQNIYDFMIEKKDDEASYLIDKYTVEPILNELYEFTGKNQQDFLQTLQTNKHFTWSYIRSSLNSKRSASLTKSNEVLNWQLFCMTIKPDIRNVLTSLEVPADYNHSPNEIVLNYKLSEKTDIEQLKTKLQETTAKYNARAEFIVKDHPFPSLTIKLIGNRSSAVRWWKSKKAINISLPPNNDECFKNNLHYRS